MERTTVLDEAIYRHIVREGSRRGLRAWRIRRGFRRHGLDWPPTPPKGMKPDQVVAPSARGRATYMQLSDVHALDDWGRTLTSLFNGEVAFVVGSCLHRADFRDVDVRLILADGDYSRLSRMINLRRLSHVVSQWGQAVTRLPIDFQVQQMTAANAKHDGPRNALGIGDWDQQAGDAAPRLALVGGDDQ